MVSEILLVRHGQIEANVKKLWHGTTDHDLTEEGLRQVLALGQGAPRKYPSVSKVYCSPLKRTLTTAQALAGGYGQIPQTLPGLIEYGIGEFEGTSYVDLHEKHDFFSKIAADQNFALTGGESVNDVHGRMRQSYEQVLAQHPGERIALVGHGAAFAILLAGLLNGAPFPFADFHLSNTGVAHLIIQAGEQRPELRVFDDQEHLGNSSPGVFTEASD